MINYLILHLLFIVYALNTVLGRMAAPYGWTDWRRFALLAGVLFGGAAGGVFVGLPMWPRKTV